MNFFAFIFAVSMAVLVMEIFSPLIFGEKRSDAQDLTNDVRLMDDDTERETKIYKRNTLEALILALWPSRFDPNRAKDRDTIEGLLRRSGYYYSTVGEFYAAALRDFVMFLILGAVFAGLMSMMKLAPLGIAMAALLIYNGLRWPYGRLKNIAKQRAEAVQNNMLVAMTIMESLVAAGKSAQEGADCASKVGGPFCAVLSAYLSSLASNPEHPDVAMEDAKSYLPDPNNLDAILFLEAIKDSEKGRSRFLETVHVARIEAQRKILNTSAARASSIQQRAVIYGFMAAVGMVVTLVLPYVMSFSLGF
jgi:hypothetical protein